MVFILIAVLYSYFDLSAKASPTSSDVPTNIVADLVLSKENRISHEISSTALQAMAKQSYSEL